jgi:aspartate/methionine/tyrosine aminotransferase
MNDNTSPTTPPLSQRLGRVGKSVYSQLLHKLKGYEGELYPLHVGDTYLPPAVSIHQTEETAALHRYTPVRGLPALVERACDDLGRRQGMVIERDELLVTGGATGGLSALLAALLTPGDEVLLLAPYWPLMAGATRLMGGTPIAVPFFQRGLNLEDSLKALDAHYTSKAKVLYINTPNNPTGEVLERSWVEALITWAERRGLWVISDEVYDYYSYDRPHTYARPLAPDRVISAYSMSKAYGMAGYRCGLLNGPAEVLSSAERAATHTMYSAPTPAQWAGLHALGARGEAWASEASIKYREIGHAVARRLNVSPPQGSTFLFIDVTAETSDGGPFAEGGVNALLEACVAKGLLVAPGNAFGPYPHHVRLCFTAAPPEVVLRGAGLLADLLGRPERV